MKILLLIDHFLPSLVKGTPISIFDAMAAGKAIIANDLPSICEILKDAQDSIQFNQTLIRIQKR